MAMIVLFDTETTALHGEIVEVASVVVDDSDMSITHSKCDLVKPSGVISYGAMGIHNITEEMVYTATPWSELQEKYLVPEDYYIGAHNWQFDSKMLGESFQNNEAICTLKLARTLISKSECDSHSNMSLFYYLVCYKEGMPEINNGFRSTHSALFDVTITARILIAMMKKFDLTLGDCYNLSNGSVSVKGFFCNIRKHKGKLWKDVLQEDVSYVEWVIDKGILQGNEQRELIKMYDNFKLNKEGK